MNTFDVLRNQFLVYPSFEVFHLYAYVKVKPLRLEQDLEGPTEGSGPTKEVMQPAHTKFICSFSLYVAGDPDQIYCSNFRGYIG